MNHTHREGFCVSCALSRITPLLPHQGPIKDFIHQNTLIAFLDEQFDEALPKAAELFGAKAYMDLSYYRNKYHEGLISDHNVDHAIHEFYSRDERDAVRDALANFLEIIDEKTYERLLAKTGPQAAPPIEHQNVVSRKTISSVMNERIKRQIDHEVNAMLFRLIGSYVDQGVGLWPLLAEKDNFKEAMKYLVQNSTMPLTRFADNREMLRYLSMNDDDAIMELLHNLVSPELFEDYLQESVFDHPGWSGMINIIAHNPDTLAKTRTITISSVLVVKLAFVWQFVKAHDANFKPIHADELHTLRTGMTTHEMSLNYWLASSKSRVTASENVKQTISLLVLQKIWQHAFEQHYYESIAAKFYSHPIAIERGSKKFQAIFCIDDRECSVRRHLEAQSTEIETFAYPGFFGIDCYFKPHKKDLLEKLCPAQVTPKYLITEQSIHDEHTGPKAKLMEFASFISRHGANSILFGFISAYTLGHLSLFRLLLSFAHPLDIMKSKQISMEEAKTTLRFHREHDSDQQQGLNLGYTHQEMADRVFNALQSMGLNRDFAPIIFSIAHGSSSVNNPHFAAYDCGACSGRPGGINARIFATMANTPEVRELVKNKGITIPNTTLFVGGLHDTCTDVVTFFDTEKLPPHHAALMEEFSQYIYVAMGKNAVERCKKFAVVDPNISPEHALIEVGHRARALFEPRPELGHATNALCVVGRRMRTSKENFDRRAFFQSYDPLIDPSGQILTSILTAVIPVCGGISLEYFFSRVDPAVYGCGTKLSHNVCSLIGVGNGIDDDLRTGLPIQMTEIHEPLRLLIVIEQEPDVIMTAIHRNASLVPWVTNDWIKIASLDPHSNQVQLYNPKTSSFSLMHHRLEATC